MFTKDENKLTYDGDIVNGYHRSDLSVTVQNFIQNPISATCSWQ